MDDELLTVPEVASMLKVNEQTVRRWLREGALSGARLGRNPKAGWRVRRSDVQHFLDDQRGEVAAA